MALGFGLEMKAAVDLDAFQSWEFDNLRKDIFLRVILNLVRIKLNHWRPQIRSFGGGLER